ncbi:hypothetical protein [Cytobacillus pseudoceanisediminis]|uniref:hypothetical protein n=1 Tax=Cytobacillus pseudoceanisediminis TaxID=3051614 RepID=UPI003C2D5FD3
MPIVDIKKTKQLEFGYGDIEVAAGLMQSENTLGAVLFWNGEQTNEIGACHNFDEQKVVKIEETPVRMVFSKIESIDVVINALERSKQMMISGTTQDKQKVG